MPRAVQHHGTVVLVIPILLVAQDNYLKTSFHHKGTPPFVWWGRILIAPSRGYVSSTMLRDGWCQIITEGYLGRFKYSRAPEDLTG